MRVSVIGGTGLVGGLLLDRLAMCGDATVHSIQRRATATRECVTVVVADATQWPAQVARAGSDILMSALGSTIASAGSKEAFRRVDHDLLLDVARAARGAGTRQMVAVSSVGATARSGNFYLRTKGEVEEGLRALGFDRLDILRPGVLVGARAGAARPAEALAMRAAPLTDRLLHGRLRRYRSIPAAVVAKAMVALLQEGGDGVHVHEHDAIASLAARG